MCVYVCMYVSVCMYACMCVWEHISLFRGFDMGVPRIKPTGLPLGLPELTGNAGGARAPAGPDHRCAVCFAAS